MNWIDFFILFVLLVALLNGYRRGTFKELTTFLGLTLGIIFAVTNADWVAGKLQGKISISPSILYVISFAIAFVACIGVLKLVGRYFYKMVRLEPLKAPHKLGGGIFGVMKGLVVLSLLFLLFLFPTPFRSFDQAIESSAMARPLRNLVPLVYDGTSFLHPRSGKFLSEVQRGILLSDARLYALNPEKVIEKLGPEAQGEKETLEKLNRYFGKAKQGEE